MTDSNSDSDSDSPTLTRRDALTALAAAGIAGGAGYAVTRDTDDAPGDDSDENGDGAGSEPPDQSLPDPTDEHHLEILVAAAEVLYPSELDGIEPFVGEFVRRRATAQPDHAEGIVDAVTYLDDWTGSWFDDAFAALDPGDRESALDQMGVREAGPDPDGTDAERVRYFVVNELLFALYASPTGGELVGIENPQGHPGGIESYQRGPDR